MVCTQTECEERTRKSTVKDKGGEQEVSVIKKKERRTTATTNGNNVVTATRAKYSVLPVCVCRWMCFFGVYVYDPVTRCALSREPHQHSTQQILWAGRPEAKGWPSEGPQRVPPPNQKQANRDYQTEAKTEAHLLSKARLLSKLETGRPTPQC